jgi:hypothetical protein
MFDIIFAGFTPQSTAPEIQHVIKNIAVYPSGTIRRNVEIIIAGAETDIVGDVRISVNRVDAVLADLIEILNETGNEFLAEAVAKYTLRNL